LKIFLGNKAYSSWSLRAWLMLRATGATFEERVIPLDQPDTGATLSQLAPSGLVPTLQDEDMVVWDSLAIGEYLAERFPNAGLWPSDQRPRAIARAIAAEMHAGFVALRSHMPMDLKHRWPGHGRALAVKKDITRITRIWRERLAVVPEGTDGFLFGPWSLADIMFAPVCTRFQTFGVDLDAFDATSGVAASQGCCTAYCRAVLSHPDMVAWSSAAAKEPWTIQHELIQPAQAAW